MMGPGSSHTNSCGRGTNWGFPGYYYS
jgi:hypothetical protein